MRDHSREQLTRLCSIEIDRKKIQFQPLLALGRIGHLLIVFDPYFCVARCSAPMTVSAGFAAQHALTLATFRSQA
jgi:hypothetical protein